MFKLENPLGCVSSFDDLQTNKRGSRSTETQKIRRKENVSDECSRVFWFVKESKCILIKKVKWMDKEALDSEVSAVLVR